MPDVVDLHAEYLPGPVTFVPTRTPRLSWRTETDTADWTQASAQVRLTHASGREEVHELTEGSVLVDWPFAPLSGQDRVSLSVRVTGADGVASPWSESLIIECVSVDPDGWHAELIAHPSPADLTPLRFVRDLVVKDGLVAARLRATAHGVYQVEINGSIVGDEVLAPGWTSYRDRLLVQTHDVTDLLAPGPARVAATVAAGWFGENFGFFGHARRAYDGSLALSAQLELRYSDGSTDIVGTDPTWSVTAICPITASGIYNGEHHDARRETAGWSLPGTVLPGLTPAAAVPLNPLILAPVVSPPVRRLQTVTPVQSFLTSSGHRVLDFGQNIAGRLRITVRGDAGQVITLRHAEVLEEGELALRPLRLAKATDSYTCAGSGLEEWEPEFTFHGFRFAQIDGWPDDADPVDDVIAVVIHSDMRRTGSWGSSDQRLNRLHDNIVWSMRGNFLSVPSDCPQRDERLGWTGDLQLFAPTACFLYDARGFLASWLADLDIEQRALGGITPLVVPAVLPPVLDPVAAWGDAATIVPWTMYERYADLGILRQQYRSMQDWVEAELARTDQLLWLRGGQIGDHLDPTAPPDRPTETKTAPEIVACAYFVRSLRIVGEAAGLLGHTEDASRYSGLADRARDAFDRLFVTPGGRMVSDAPTAYALALAFDLVTDHDRRQALGERLAELVRESNYRIATGFVGTPLLLDALLATGQTHTAGRLLLQTRAPSWLYPVTMGATTVWERWDSLLPDGRVNPGEMTSFNHYALGSVADTLHRRVAGLSPAEPGYRRITVAPQPLPGLTAAAAALDTPYGRVSVSWEHDDQLLRLTVLVPPNATADVQIPGSDTVTVGSGTHEFTGPAPAPSSPPGPVDLNTDLAVLVDDIEALAAVQDTLASRAPDLAGGLMQETRWKAGARLADVFMFAGDAVTSEVAKALATVSLSRSEAASAGRPTIPSMTSAGLA